MRALAAASALLVAGCMLNRAPIPAPDQGDWPRIRDAHSRSVKLYDGLGTVAFATAVWESPEVRAARVARTAEWAAMTATERAALQAEEDAIAARFEEFTISLFTAERADNDLDAPRPTWRMALVFPGGEALPVSVAQLRPDALLRSLYPVGDFDLVYRLRFPKVDAGGAQPFTLRLAGARGRLDFPFAAAQPERVAAPGQVERY